jgi:DNA-directed RNA polymerase subunit RPC12/RpoP
MQPNKPLVNCPDCGHQVSKKAATCPACGRRIAFGTVMFLAICCAFFVWVLFSVFVVAVYQLANLH